MIFIIMFARELSYYGHYLLRPLENDPHAELVTIMIAIPLVLNVL